MGQGCQLFLYTSHYMCKLRINQVYCIGKQLPLHLGCKFPELPENENGTINGTPGSPTL